MTYQVRQICYPTLRRIHRANFQIFEAVPLRLDHATKAEKHFRIHGKHVERLIAAGEYRWGNRSRSFAVKA